MGFKRKSQKLLQKFPVIGDYFKMDVPPGHFYNPIVSAEYIEANSARIFNNIKENITGIDLNKTGQLKLLEELKELYPTIPFPKIKTNGFRYYYENGFYSYSDAIFLHLVLRKFQPERIIEVGSGFSSAVTLDTNEMFFDNKMKCTFIEPNPERLYSILKPSDSNSVEIIPKEVQTVNTDKFRELKENDILFIDSSHVSKAGSDVNYIFFEILPVLREGVLIHFHDIYYPLEYPKELILSSNGFGANEIYLLRTFLMDNPKYEIMLFNTYLEQIHSKWFEQNMPLCLLNKGGNIWLKKIKE